METKYYTKSDTDVAFTEPLIFESYFIYLLKNEIY